MGLEQASIRFWCSANTRLVSEDSSESSEDESESEDEDSEDESESQGDSDSGSDSDPDSDDDPEFGGDYTSGRENSEDMGSGEQVSRSNSEGGNSEGNNSGQSPEASIVPSSGEASKQDQRPQRIRRIPSRFADFSMLHDTEVDSEGEIVQCAMLVDSEPVGIEEAVKKKVWLNAMK